MRRLVARNAQFIWRMLILLCLPAAGGHGPQVNVRIGEASNPGPGLNGFDVAEPDWSDHESDDEGELAFDAHLEEWYADWLVGPRTSPRLCMLGRGSRLKKP